MAEEVSLDEFAGLGQNPNVEANIRSRQLGTRDATLARTIAARADQGYPKDAKEDVTQENMADLENEISRTRDPKQRAILVAEHNRIKGVIGKQLEAEDARAPFPLSAIPAARAAQEQPQEGDEMDVAAFAGAGPKQSPTAHALQFLRQSGGEAAALADLVLSLPGMALGLGANLSSTTIGLAAGETSKEAFTSGQAIGHRVADVFSNPLQKLIAMFGDESLYEDAKTTIGMKKLSAAIDRAGAWTEAATNGKLPSESVNMLADTLMVALGARGGDIAGELAKKRASPEWKLEKQAEVREQPLPVEEGPTKTAQQQINEMLDIKSSKERGEYNARRQKEVREAFKKDPDYADYLRSLADERVQMSDAWTDTARKAEQRDINAELQAVQVQLADKGQAGRAALRRAEYEAEYYGGRQISMEQAMEILQKPGEARTAEDLLNIRAWNRQGRPVEGPMKQEGKVSVEQAGYLASGAVVAGAAADYVLNPEHRERYESALKVGGLAGGALLAVKGKGGMWHPEAVERLAQPLKDKLVQLHEVRTPEDAKISSAKFDWSNKASRNYLNKHAGTESDPLRDVQIPAGTGTKSWGDIVDKLIEAKPRRDYIDENSGAVKPEFEHFKKAPAEEPVFNMSDRGAEFSGADLQSYLSHVGDYLREHVPPAKLQQYDLVRAVKETAKWDEELAKKMNSVEGRLEGTVPYKAYPDKFQWVEVKSEEALKREGDIMGHCVGGYCGMVENGEARIFSLRDPKGMSHVTIEVSAGNKLDSQLTGQALVRAVGREKQQDISHAYINQGKRAGTLAQFIEAFYPEEARLLRDAPSSIEQIKGKQNRAPNKEYLPYVQDFVKSGKWGEVGDLENAGLKDLHEFKELVKNTKDLPGAKEMYDRRFISEDELTYLSSGGRAGRVGGGAKERGFIEQKLVARMAAVGIGVTAGIALDPSNKIEGAILGALAGLGVSSLSPKGVAAVVKRAWEPDKRIRVNDLANAHDTAIAQTSRATWQLQEKIEGLVPDPKRREQVTHWLEGDKSIRLSAKEIEAANQVRQYFDAIRDEGQKAGVLKSAMDNYVTHLWEFGSQTRSALEEVFGKRGGANMSPESKYALRRSVPTIAEGKQLGLKPVTEDISAILGIYGNAINRSLANKQMLQALKAEKVPGSDVNLVMPSSKAPPFYVSVDHPQLSGMRVHPDIAPSLRFIYDNSNPGVVQRGLEGLNIMSKRLAVSFSLFHAKALGDAFIGASNNPLAVGKQIAQAVSPRIFGQNTFIRQLKEGGAGDLVDKAQTAGLKFSFERTRPAVEDVNGTFYTAMKDLQVGLDALVPGLGLPVKGFTKLNHIVDTFMWERLHAGMKLSIFSEKLTSLLENNAKARLRDPTIPVRSEGQLAEMAASFTNDLFGGLNWRRVAEESRTKWGRDATLAVYSPTGRRVSQLLLFAPDWTLSTVRAMTKAFGEGSGLGGLTEAKTTADLHRQYLVRSAIYYAVVGDAINYSMSGHHLWENKDWTTIDMGDGRKMQWSKHTMEPVHWLTKPGQQGLNKLGMVPREIANQLMGTDYLSTSGHAPRMDTSPLGRAKHFGKQFTPISVQQNFEAGPSSGIAGFFGAPIYGMTEKQKLENRELRRLKRAMEGPKK